MAWGNEMFCFKFLGHMTKIAATPSCRKILYLLQNPSSNYLAAWCVALEHLQFISCLNDDPILTLSYLTTRARLASYDYI